MYHLLQRLYYRYFDISKKDYKRIYAYFYGCRHILDVGCGKGDFCINNPKKIAGIDINRTSLKAARANGCTVRYGDARNIPYKSISFDGIFCAHIIEHFNTKDAMKVLKELNRVLKPGGILVIQTPLMHDAFYNNFTHEKIYTPEAIMHYYGETLQPTYAQIGSFRIEKLIYRYADLYNPVIEPVRLPNGFYRSFCIGMKVLSLFCYSIGIRNYFKKNGYTLVLRKRP